MWEGPYRIKDALGKVVYHLEELLGVDIPQISNATILKQYFS